MDFIPSPDKGDNTNKILFKLNDYNIEDFVNMIYLSDYPDKIKLLQNIAIIAYKWGINIKPFIPVLDADIIINIHRTTICESLNRSFILDNQDLYNYLAINHATQLFSLPSFTFLNDRNYGNIYKITANTIINSLGESIKESKVIDDTDLPQDIYRIVFKLEQYNGNNIKLNDMYQVTYAYACDILYDQLQQAKAEKKTMIDLPCICNPYLVQYYQNYRNKGWEWNRNSENGGYNEKRCNVDHTLLLNKGLVNNLLKYANMDIQSNNWSGVINGPLAMHRHKTAVVSVNRNLVKYADKEHKAYYSDNRCLMLKDGHLDLLSHPITRFNEDKHVKYITTCINQYDDRWKHNMSKDKLIQKYGYTFESLFNSKGEVAV